MITFQQGQSMTFLLLTWSLGPSQLKPFISLCSWSSSSPHSQAGTFRYQFTNGLKSRSLSHLCPQVPSSDQRKLLNSERSAHSRSHQIKPSGLKYAKGVQASSQILKTSPTMHPFKMHSAYRTLQVFHGLHEMLQQT